MEKEHPIELEAWRPFDPSLCESCWAGCCHGMPVQVGVADLVRLGLLTEEEAAGDLESQIQRLQNEGALQLGSPEPWVWILAQEPSGDCVFLGPDRRCTVYEERPQICREFPDIGPKPGHCPYRDKANPPV